MKKLFYILAFLLALSAPTFGADSTVVNMTADTAPTSDDLLYVVDNPSGVAADRKVTLGNAVTKAHGLTDGVVTVSSGEMSTAAAGGNNYILGSNSNNSALEFKAPADVLSQIGAAASTFAYGLRWNLSGDSYVLGSVINGYFITTASLITFPVQEKMKRCVLSDAGVVQYYLCKTNSAQKADCSTPSVLGGTDGQVMVEIPKFHYIQYQSSNFRYWLIGENEFTFILPGSGGTVLTSTIHPFFYKGGSSVASDYRYIGAYEANLWDASGSAYVGGASITEDCVNDKLSSVSGVLPIVNFTLPCGRTMAAARGAGWHQFDHAAQAALHILYLTEYGNLKSQAALGNGITGYVAWPNGPQALAGNSNSIGDASGSSYAAVAKWAASTTYAANTEVIPNATQNGYTYRVTAGGGGQSGGSEPTWPTTLGNTVVDNAITWTCVRTLQYVSYRGIENWYGHVWKFVDGANINNDGTSSKLYLSTNHSQYSSDTATNYTYAGDLLAADGWVTDILNVVGVWPKTGGGASTTYLADYYYTQYDTSPSGGWRVALFGGDAISGSSAGASYWYSTSSSSSAFSYLGGRLCF